MAVDPVGCIALAGAILSACYNYGVSAVNSPEEAKRLFDETAALAGILTLVQNLSSKKDDPDIHDLELTQQLEECHQALLKVNRRLTEHAPKDHERKTQKLLRKLSWPFRVDETKAMIQSIEKQKSTLNLALSAHSLRAIQDHDTKLDDVAASVSDVRSMITSEKYSKRQHEIFQWLTELDQRSHHERICRQKYKDTGNWIFDMREYNEWSQMKRSALWYQGEAGSGKTFLVSHIIEHCFKELEQNPDFLVAYLYFDASTNESLTVEALLGMIIKQLCYVKGIPDYIDDSYESCRMPGEGFREPKLDALMGLLERFLKSVPRLTVVVDAVDESASPEDVFDILQTIKNWPTESCHIFVSSRPGGASQDLMPDAILLSSPLPFLQNDILQYLEQRLQQDKRFRKLGSDTRKDVRKRVSERADGMIRWAQCMLDDIATQRTDHGVKQALKVLPKSLGDLYTNVLLRIVKCDHKNSNGEDELCESDEEGSLSIQKPLKCDHDMAKQALLWLTHSVHPLTLQALSEAVILDKEQTSIDPGNRLNEPQDLLGLLPMLVTYNHITRETRLAHHSVREFLIRENPSSFSWPTRGSHREIAVLCLTYLLSSNFDSGAYPTVKSLTEALQSYPLLSYAALNWPQHVSLTNSEEVLVPLITRLLTPEVSPHYLLWLQIVLLHSTHGFTRPGVYGTARNPIPLYYAASYNLPHTVTALVKAGANINARAGQNYGTPLHVACFRGHLNVAQQLLVLGADPYTADHSGRTAYTFMRRLIRVYDAPVTRDLLARVTPPALKNKNQKMNSGKEKRVDSHAANVAKKMTTIVESNSDERQVDPSDAAGLEEASYASEFARLEALDREKEKLDVVKEKI